MVRLLLIFASFGAIIGAPKHTATTASPGLGIYGGKFTEIEKYPYQVSIELNEKVYCSGAIISPEWVITSAVCAQKQNNNTWIRSGSTYRSQYGKTRQIWMTKIHENFNPSDKENNIALLRVREPLFEQEQAVYLAAHRQHIDVKTKGMVSGWGTNNKDEQHRHLFEIEAEVLENRKCNLEDRRRVYANEFCAKPTVGGSGLCYGDEGAPLVVKGFQPQRDTLLGIASIRNHHRSNCNGHEADLYVNVGAHRKWIDDIVQWVP